MTDLSTVTVIGPPASTNTPMPDSEFPSAEKIATTDLVGPTAANHMPLMLEKRTLSLRDKVNQLIANNNIIDEVYLRRSGATQLGGTAGLTGDLPGNGHTITGIRAAAVNGEPVRYEEFLAEISALAGSLTLPSGMISSFAMSAAPTGWVAADGTTYRTNDIVDALGTTMPYPLGLSWAGMADLLAALGTTWGGDGVTTFRVPDYRGRTIIGAGTGIIGGTLSARAAGAYLGAETHTLTIPEIPSHTHTVQGVSAGENGGGSTHYATAFFDTNYIQWVQYTGGGGAHNNMQPSAASLICIKL
jgi:microcystin-dependent protein